jgi:DNA invertase Pin-like site-specific DNA recombinase
MKLLGYTRVSDRRGHDDSHEAQEKMLRAWCRREGHKLVRVIREENGTSGTMKDRVGWADTLNALKDGEAQGVVVRDLERLARDFMIQEQLLQDVWGMEREAFSTMPSEADLRDDPEDPTRKLIRVIVGAVHAHNRDMNVLRLVRGKRAKAQRDGYIGGSMKYGYVAEDGEYKPEDREQAAIVLMQELRAGGASLREIADTLVAEGYRAKRGGPWHPQTIARVLSRV